MKFSALELCAGGGGQALGLEMAGFECCAAVEIDKHACVTLKSNRPKWIVINDDIQNIKGQNYRGIDLLAGGVPCPPFSVAGKQLGSDDERDMFPAALHLIEDAKPRAVLLENVPGLASAKFADYRQNLLKLFDEMGYAAQWKVLHSSKFGVPQLRPRFILVGLRREYVEFFQWPRELNKVITVGETLHDLMSSNNWPGATQWAERANRVAPTIVGGSKKHGGPDLGPTRAKQQWRELGVDGNGIAEFAPDQDFPVGDLPRLTVRMVARIQSFPDDWEFSGKKTNAYRQVGNAFPPLVACAVGKAIKRALDQQQPKFVAVYEPSDNFNYLWKVEESAPKWQRKRKAQKS